VQITLAFNKDSRGLSALNDWTSYYLLDRDGNIAAKDLPSFKKLSSAIADLVNKR
jgi:hypothetical protein